MDDWTSAGEAPSLDILEGLIAAVADPADENHAPVARRFAEQLSKHRGAVEKVIEASLRNPDRLAALHETGLMSGGATCRLDRIAELTAEALGTGYAAITLVDSDSQFLAGCSVAAAAADVRRRPIEVSVSRFVVASGHPLFVADATVHPLLGNNPAVRSGEVLAFAGVLLLSDTLQAVGTLCAWDTHPHRWSSGQRQLLEDFAELTRANIFA
ncbi:GAF domain-containing protein [Mycolicibacterium mengxianglii]|uniref:GAF domain-containing protein n=1 Tax=Mycolicibacterium mengxianglii TaxID=2736649 RepID=UPI0018EEF1E5|nr:GAF domain-containing protein [Mycolicibacterium mengxianglii]